MNTVDVLTALLAWYRLSTYAALEISVVLSVRVLCAVVRKKTAYHKTCCDVASGGGGGGGGWRGRYARWRL